MSRRIVSKQLRAMGAGRDLDTYFDRVVKYIPADIVGAWVAVTGLIAAATDVPTATILWIAFISGVVLTPLWMWRQTSVSGQPPAITQIVIATIAFIVWVFALGGPFATLVFYNPLYGSLLLVFYTLIVALIIPKE